jgi:DNA-binding transcriptional LysR family regulator
MGIALLPKSVLSTFPEAASLDVHKLPRNENHIDIFMIWRKGARSPKVEALRQLLAKRVSS